jgi:hypothetical protein
MAGVANIKTPRNADSALILKENSGFRNSEIRLDAAARRI